MTWALLLTLNLFASNDLSSLKSCKAKISAIYDECATYGPSPTAVNSCADVLMGHAVDQGLIKESDFFRESYGKFSCSVVVGTSK